MLVDFEQVPQVLLGDAEAKQHPDGHPEGKLLCLLVHIDGLGVATPGTQRVLDHQLYLGQVALQGLVAEDLGKDLEGTEAGQVSRAHQDRRGASKSPVLLKASHTPRNYSQRQLQSPLPLARALDTG